MCGIPLIPPDRYALSINLRGGCFRTFCGPKTFLTFSLFDFFFSLSSSVFLILRSMSYTRKIGDTICRLFFTGAAVQEQSATGQAPWSRQMLSLSLALFLSLCLSMAFFPPSTLDKCIYADASFRLPYILSRLIR